MVITNVIKHSLLALIWIYQKTLSPVLGRNCRFYPSCSSYASQCLNKFILTKAISKISIRLSKCHPRHPGGVDLP